MKSVLSALSKNDFILESGPDVSFKINQEVHNGHPSRKAKHIQGNNKSLMTEEL